MELTCPHERDYVQMRNGRQPVHEAISLQKIAAIAAISNEEFAVDHLMAGSLVPVE
jgi:hypothetical protein